MGKSWSNNRREPANVPLQSSKDSNISKKLQNLDNILTFSAKRLLPAYDVSFDWDVYLDKKPIWKLIKGVTPHEKLIIKLKDKNDGDYKGLAIEIGTEGGILNKRENWSLYVSLVNDDDSTEYCVKQGTANFSLEALRSYIEDVTSKFGNYNVLSNNCQTFARKIIDELGNIKTDKWNDAQKLCCSTSTGTCLTATSAAGVTVSWVLAHGCPR